MGKSKIKSIKSKVVVAFLAILTPILIGIVTIYFQGHQSMIKNAKNMMQLRQDNMKAVLEDELLNLYNFQLDYTVNNDVNYLIDIYHTLSEEEQLSHIREIMEELYLVKRNNDWIYDLRINIPSLSLSISYEGLKHKIPTYDQLGVFEKQNTFALFFMLSNRLCFSSKFPVHGEDVKYNIVCEIKEETLESFLSSYCLPDESICLLDNEQNKLITSVDHLSIFNDYSNLASQFSYDLNASEKSVFYNQKEYIGLKQDLFFNHLTIVSVMSKADVVSYIVPYKTLFIITVIVSIIMIMIYYVVFSRIIDHPIQMLLTSFRLVNEKPNQSIPIDYAKNDEFRLLFDGFRDMVSHLQDYIEENYHHKILVQQMHLRQLQAQIDPHFLHNCFLNIYSLAELEDYELVQKFVKNLSQYYEYVTKNHQDIVSLREEYDFCHQYIEIQNIRVGDYVDVEMQPLPLELENVKVPRFILQPLIENAYKYGGFSRLQHGLIQLSFHLEQNNIVIDVCDNGNNFTIEKLQAINDILCSETLPSSGTGIFNVQRRIQIYYKNNSRVEVFQSRLGGLGIRVLVQYGKELLDDVKGFDS